MVKSPPSSHVGINKYCVTLAGRGTHRSAGSREQGLWAQPPRPAPPHTGRPGLSCPHPSLRAQDDVDAGIREHGPAHLPCPQSKGGVFKWLLHLTWGSMKAGCAGGSRPGPGARTGQSQQMGRPHARPWPSFRLICHRFMALSRGQAAAQLGAAGLLRRPQEAGGQCEGWQAELQPLPSTEEILFSNELISLGPVPSHCHITCPTCLLGWSAAPCWLPDTPHPILGP